MSKKEKKALGMTVAAGVAATLIASMIMGTYSFAQLKSKIK